MKLNPQVGIPRIAEIGPGEETFTIIEVDKENSIVTMLF